jgi:hypothetical protein
MATMKQPYLEVTFRHGRPVAAYYSLPRDAGQKSAKTRRVEPARCGAEPRRHRGLVTAAA